ncbi:MAG TPA: TonB-dependent receptor [Terriglobales bacterium]|nr:TonB-dependent receptor [Terriglobales bacterium]
MTEKTGTPVANAIVHLYAVADSHHYEDRTSAAGEFHFENVIPGDYKISVEVDGRNCAAIRPVAIRETENASIQVQLCSEQQPLQVEKLDNPRFESGGGEHLSREQVSNLPLNARDFSKLLLLAAGTMTDTNGAANFTQQFATNGQRGSTGVFALDGGDTTDPEMGGATFSNFNVDAIQEVQSSSGVMPAEIGHGAAGYTNVVSRSGTEEIHGSMFEFVRNAAFDARNYFDHLNPIDRRRIPPFARNEFGLTLGGPVILPYLYDGRSRTYFFGEYQGFRQVLGTTQVLAVPTVAERQGIDTTAFPGDTLTVPVNPAVAAILNGYPLPNNPHGAFGERTYETSSKVATNTDQFSVRVDQVLSKKASMLARFSLNQVNGPLTNPDQTAINPTFGIHFFDHQRSATVKYSRAISSRFTSDTQIAYIRSTPFFPSSNHTQPAIAFGDGLYAAYNSADGSIIGSYSNLYQLKHDMSYTRGQHSFKWGIELRANRDATIFGTNPNGAYSFGGGIAYSPLSIASASGQHDIAVGHPLPDSLTGLLTATPYSYTITVAAEGTPAGDKFDEAAARREAYDFYFQDNWKASRRLSVSYGLRYEVNSRIHEAQQRTSGPKFIGADGRPASYWDHSATQIFIYDPQPPYDQDWSGFGPRLGLDYNVEKNTVLHAGAGITSLVPNLWQDNFLTGSMPFIFTPYVNALPGVALPFQNAVTPVALPPVYTAAGQLLFPYGRSTVVPPNTQLDLDRFQHDQASLTPGHQPQLLSVEGIAKEFRNGYIATYRAGVEHNFRDVNVGAFYVATAGVHLSSVFSPNSYGGAEPMFAPFTRFDSAGHAVGGFGPEMLMTSGSHSTYHSLQASVGKNSARAGLGIQASYTFSKSLDDTSAVLGGGFTSAGPVLQTLPQNPWNPSADKGPSTFDVTHVFTLNWIQMLPLQRVSLLQRLGRPLTKGWQFLNVTTVMSGSPFTVYSGVQQTGAGATGADRPDPIGRPDLSTSRSVREDYFGRGTENSSLFYIPVGVPGGTGPNHGRFGTLGRNTFRGPAFHNMDIGLVKDTNFGHRGNGELGTIEFRAEFFNIFNIVNFGLPSNIVRGSGFGIISKTAGNSRQIQFSLKLLY